MMKNQGPGLKCKTKYLGKLSTHKKGQMGPEDPIQPWWEKYAMKLTTCGGNDDMCKLYMAH